MMKLRAQVSKNLECGDLSPLLPLCDLSPKQGRVQWPGRVGRLPAFDGDKSPAESADKSAHSKVLAASPRWVHSWLRGIGWESSRSGAGQNCDKIELF